jgi:putative transcriptional regulator
MEYPRGHPLVAAPGLIDPNFHRTVVLLGEHSDDGALGVVLNRESDVTVSDAVPELGELLASNGRVHIGGPVQPQAIVVLAEFTDPEQAGALVLDTVGFLPGEVEPEELGELGRARVFAGYAGWGPGQLESELAEESWIVEPAVPDDVFTAEPEVLWNEVLRRKGGPFAILASMPPDPGLN